MAGYAFWRILKATERSVLQLYAEIFEQEARPRFGRAIAPCANVEPSLMKTVPSPTVEDVNTIDYR